MREILAVRDIARQKSQIVADLWSDEFEEAMIRRMTRQEFRQLLRERLQEFGDKCLAAWDEKFGGQSG